MKRIYIFFIIIFSFFSFFCSKNDVFYDYFKNFPTSEFCYVTDKEKENVRTIKNGDMFLNYFLRQEKHIIDAKYKHVYIDASEQNVCKIIKDLNIAIREKEMYEEREIYFGYTPFFSKNIYHGQHKINVQIVVLADKILIGYPCVYISF